MNEADLLEGVSDKDFDDGMSIKTSFETKLMGRLIFDCQGYLAPGDFRYGKEDRLWALSIDAQIAMMRELHEAGAMFTTDKMIDNFETEMKNDQGVKDAHKEGRYQE